MTSQSRKGVPGKMSRNFWWVSKVGESMVPGSWMSKCPQETKSQVTKAWNHLEL